MPTPQNESSPSTAAEARVSALEAVLQDREGKLREATALYEDAKRELPLVRARIERSAREELQTWKEGFLGGFLEVLDDVERAIDAASAPGVDPALREGLELLGARFSSKLAEEGVLPIEDSARFDPHLHEAVATRPVGSPQHDGVILANVQTGYRLDDRVLRPTRVVVGAHR